MASFSLARRNLRDLLRTAAATAPDGVTGEAEHVLGAAVAPASARPAVQVVLGPPINYEAEEVIGILGMDAVDADFATISSQEDRFEIAGRIKVYRPWSSGEQDDIDDLDERAWDIFDAVRVIVDGEPGNYQLAGALVDGWAILAPTSGEDGPLPAVNDAGEFAGWVEYIPFVVRCTARA